MIVLVAMTGVAALVVGLIAGQYIADRFASRLWGSRPERVVATLSPASGFGTILRCSTP